MKIFKTKGWWYSEAWSDKTARKAGTKHGKAGLESMADLVIKTRLQECGPFAPESNEEHADLDRRCKPNDHVPEFKAGLQKAEQRLDKYPNRWLLRCLFVFMLGVEYAGMNELLAGQGMDNPHLTIVAMAGASIFFYLTHVAAKAKGWWFAALMLGMALFVGSMAVLWRDNTASEDTSDLTNWASTLFLVACVCGPGFVARWVALSLVPVEELAKNRRRLLREIKNAEAVCSSAVAAKTRVQDWYDWYVKESTRMRSIYELAYKEAVGKTKENPYKVAAMRRTG